MTYEAAICVQRLKALARQRGFLTYAEVNEHLPSSVVDPEVIEDIVNQVERTGIRVLESAPTDPSPP